MANGNNQKQFTDRFYAQSGANFLSSLASMERMYREDKRMDDAFRQSVLLQDKRIASQEQMQSERVQHELGMQHLTSLRNLSNDLKQKESTLEEQLKGLNYSEDTLSKLPYYEQTKDGSDLLKSFATELKNNSGLINQGDLSIADIMSTTSKYNDILEDRIKQKQKNIQIAQELDMYVDTKAPQWYHDSKDKNLNPKLDDFLQYKANLTVDEGEYKNLRISLDKPGTIFEGLSDNDHMWNKIVQQVQLVQNSEVAKMAAVNQVYAGIKADQDADFNRQVGDIEKEAELTAASIVHKTTSIAYQLPHMKYADADDALESMVTFQDNLLKRVNGIHKKHGISTAFGVELMQSAAEIANSKVSSPDEQVRVIKSAAGYLSQAFTKLDVASDADREIAMSVFELMKSSGILSTFTTEDEFINMGEMNDSITFLMGELNLLNETTRQMYKDRRTGVNLPGFVTGEDINSENTTSTDTTSTDEEVVGTVITQSIDNLYNNFTIEAPPLVDSFTESFNSQEFLRNFVDEPKPAEEDRDMPSFQGVEMPSFLHEWEFVGFKEPMMIGNNEFNSAPLLFRNKESGETTSNPEWIGQQELNYEEIGEYKDYKNKLTAIYETQASLRQMQSEVTNLKEKRARLRKNVVNKNSKYFTDKDSFYEEEIKRLSQIIVNSK
jgi:hypothetical protein